MKIFLLLKNIIVIILAKHKDLKINAREAMELF